MSEVDQQLTESATCIKNQEEKMLDSTGQLHDDADHLRVTKNCLSDSNAENNCEHSSAENKSRASFREKWKNPDYRKKCLRTLWLGASFWALGFAIGQRGPAFLDIQIITGTNVEEASFFFTAGSVGYLVGSVVAGVVYDKLNKSALLLLCVLGTAVTTVVLPWCSIYGFMIASYFLFSFFGGGLDTAGNAELVRIWGSDGKMAMQFIHFSYAFGGVIGPLATAPFLTPNPEETAQSSNFTADMANTMLNPSLEPNQTSNMPVGKQTTIVHYAFMISGCSIFLVCIPLTVQWLTDKSEKKKTGKGHDKQPVKQPLPTPLFLFVMTLLTIMYFLYCATEDTFALYLTTYMVKAFRWSKSNGAKITAVFWGSFAAFRFIGIFVVWFLSPVCLLVGCNIALFLALLAFLLFSLFHVTEGLWLASLLTGASMAPWFGTGFTWMEAELVKVTGRVASAILIASSSGTMVNPIMLGYLMEEYSPMWFAYLLFTEACLCIVTFIFLLFLSHLYFQKHYVFHTVDAEAELEIPLPAHRSAVEPVLS